MKELNTEEVYATPSTKVVSDDEKVVGQLCLFLSQLKVVNLLRQDGMSYDDAKALVETNVAEANRILRKKNLIWNLLGYLFVSPFTNAFNICKSLSFRFISNCLILSL